MLRSKPGRDDREHEDHSSKPLRIPLEKSRVGLETVFDPFRIVKPVKGQNDLRIAYSIPECPGFLLHRVALHIIPNLLVVDAHREGVNPYGSFPVDEHLAKIMFDS